ncbi:MAG: hypothetical protein A2309_06945 [Bacteroidetes bacterium RIFOXYB2_FULL_35_7]|nr:MAG: hypothetical protein A2X01_00990 [Bacteroidetes bacterium GWF2_35_48]OFY92912.1 MAG: hypothetical protein A2491_13440 [Bacteroidetes bacterium RIFOXYC12_FULL_35_7]OFY96013.1 MAG: hypothetical protein A2309_06945 [Bacteroidetes bacterium RIFOXYB2_FULL_35_7]
MSKIDNNFYIDQTEIDIGSWLSYYSWILEHDGYNAAHKILPDSTAVNSDVWKYIKTKTTDYIDIPGQFTNYPIGYFPEKCNCKQYLGYSLYYPSSYCIYLSLPITGITFEQALSFCEWRTKHMGKNKIIYRLPTPEEWSHYAVTGLSDSEKKAGYRDSLEIKRKCSGANYNYNHVELVYDIYCVGQFKSDKNKIFDIFGNVSEMTSTKGIAKGGNYTQFANQCHPDSVQHYTKPEKWLGFRCVAEKIENKEGTKANISENPTQLKTNNDTSITWDGKFGEFTDIRDGKRYRVVKIGEQIWMAQNIAYKPIEGKYWAYKNDENYILKLGYLYSWETSKNVCPKGWHLPTKEEFEKLLLSVGMSDTLAYKNLLPSSDFGFSIISSGFGGGVIFTKPEFGTGFWSSSLCGSRRVFALVHGRFSPKTFITDEFSPSIGLYVRCIKDK